MEPDLKKAEEIAKSIQIPPLPRVVMELNDVLNDPRANLDRIVDLISKDLSMSAKVLKLANSPIFGTSQNISSIKQAFIRVGTNNFSRIVLASALSDVLGGGKIDKSIFEAFWTHSLLAAKMAEMVVKTNESLASIVSSDLAYTTALFHDCAIPLLLKRFPDYKNIFTEVLSNAPDVINLEESLFESNHSVMSFIMAKSWKLPKPACRAILDHHAPNPTVTGEIVEKKLWAILALSEAILQIGNDEMEYMEASNKDAPSFIKPLAMELYLTGEDFFDLVFQLRNIMGQS
ncbi:MAG: HDOD domain-containing protein [Deltaproteobacteria bacterium]|nr:HDOD domain-containing protein [Deltaproteobacteria bacterium]